MLSNVTSHQSVTIPGEGPPNTSGQDSKVDRPLPTVDDGYQGPRRFTGTLRLEKQRLFFTPDPGSVLPSLSRALYAEGIQNKLRVSSVGFRDLGTLYFTTSAKVEAELVGQDRDAVTRALAALNKIGGGWRASVFEPNNAPK